MMKNTYAHKLSEVVVLRNYSSYQYGEEVVEAAVHQQVNNCILDLGFGRDALLIISIYVSS
jgi:hypothetical protein